MNKMAKEVQSPKYTVSPVPLLDSTTGLTDIVARISLCFQECLDIERLRQAWYKVSSAWPITNARVRISAAAPSGLEYHIPTLDGMTHLESDPDPLKRQFFGLDMSMTSIDDFSSSFADLSTSAQTTRVHHAPGDGANELYGGQNAPKSFEHALHNSVGVITVQVTVFKDGTVISLSMLHVLGDGFCIKDIFEAWTSVLRGGTPKPMYDFGLDTFAPYAPGGSLSTLSARDVKRGRDPPPPKGYYVYNCLDKASFLRHYWMDSHWTAPESEMEARFICIPHNVVAELQQEANEDLERHQLDVKVGKSDVLYAWLMKRCFSGFADSRIVNPLTIVNLRGRIPTTLPQSNVKYSSTGQQWPRHEFVNAALPTPLGEFQLRELRRMPLGQLALQIRQKVSGGADPENARALLAFTMHHGLWKNRNRNKVAIFSRPDATWIALTDWRALKFGSYDWSGALSQSSEGGQPVRPSMLHSTMLTPFSRRQRFALMGEVKSGVLLEGFLAKRQWDDVKHGFGGFVGDSCRYEGRRSGTAHL